MERREKISSEAEGYFVQVNSDVVGVIPSNEGPRLFFNRESYALTSNYWDAELMLGKESGIFTFYWMGEVKISFKCEKHRDFFLWLFNLLNARTIPEVYALA